MSVETGPVHAEDVSGGFLDASREGSEPTITVGVALLEDRNHTLRLDVPSGQYEINGVDTPLAKSETWCLEASGETVTLSKTGSEMAGGVKLLEIKPGKGVPESWAAWRKLRIGRGFHWESRLDQTLPGWFQIRARKGFLEVINVVPLEAYILGVVTGEMGVDCPPELLKAQAVAARSWVLASSLTNHPGRPMLRCNDDHCQRYQGLSEVTPEIRRAIAGTRAVVLRVGDGEILDANYSKSCGGIVSAPAVVWLRPKLGQRALFDGPDGSPAKRFFPVTEANIREYVTGDWLRDCDCYCSPQVVPEQSMERYLGRVDVSGSYFRWKVEYTQTELIKILQKNRPKDFRGITSILGFRSLERGPSGRIASLEITARDSKGPRIVRIDDQYKIRDTLHPSFLYSSAFVVDTKPQGAEVPERFILRGAGWGHGAGMCQIGALGMAIQGHDFRTILTHYFPDARLEMAY